MVAVGDDVAERTRRGIARWCAQANSPYDLLHGVAERVRPVVRQDAAAWLVTDPETVLFTDGYIEALAWTRASRGSGMRLRARAAGCLPGNVATWGW